MYVGLTTTAIDLFNFQLVLDGFCSTGCCSRGYFRIDFQQQTYRTGHITLVTTAVKVIYLSGLKMPFRHDGHICLVVATEDTREVILAVLYKVFGVDTHLQKLGIGKRNVPRLALIVDADMGLVVHGNAVTTAIDVTESTAMKIDISPINMRHSEICQGYLIVNSLLLNIIPYLIGVV